MTSMKKLLILLFLLLGLGVQAQQTSVIVGLTNAPVTGNIINISGQVFIWTNGTPGNGFFMLITNTLAGDALNLFNATAVVVPSFGVAVTNDPAHLTNVYYSSTTLSITTNTPLGWCLLATNIQATGGGTNVVIPISSVASSAARINIESVLVGDINTYSATPFESNATVMSQFMALQNPQIVYGSNRFVNASNQFLGGYYINPIFTNGQNFGNPFRSPGAATGSEQFGLGAQAVDTFTIALGDGAVSQGDNSIALGSGAGTLSPFDNFSQELSIGAGAVSSNDLTIAIGASANCSGSQSIAFGQGATAANNSSVAIGSGAASTVNHQIMLGTSSEYVHFPGNIYTAGTTSNLTTAGTNRYGGIYVLPVGANSSLVLGVNADVITTTNVYLQISGPSAAFSIVGFQGGIAGRTIIVENTTAFAMTVGNQSGLESTAANRVITGTGSDRVITDNIFTIWYDGTASRWKIISAN